MATTLIYNGVTLHNVVTREFDQESVYDESGTDLLGTRHRISVEGILHTGISASGDGNIGENTTGWIGSPGIPTNNIADMHEYIRAKLRYPRGVLEYKYGDNVILLCNPTTAEVGYADLDRDIDNGPKPRNVSVTHVAGTQVLRVKFTVECMKNECLEGPTGSLILNNRWSVQEAMDSNFFTTRTITGILRLSASNLLPSQGYRLPATPRLEAGFRRESIEFTADPTGLALHYTVTDKQVHTAAPWPATKITGTHTEATGDGVSFWSDCDVRLEGRPDADKRLLIARAIQIVDNRLAFLSGQFGSDFLIEQAAIIDHIGDVNAVEVRLRIRHLTDNITDFLGNLRADRLGRKLDNLPAVEGEPDGYDPTISQVPSLFGYDPHGEERRPAVLFLLSCYQQSPCSSDHALDGGIPLPEEEEEESPEAFETFISEGPTSSLPQGDGGSYTQAAKTAMYTMARMTSRYINRPIKAQLPIARVSSGGTETEDTSAFVELAPPQAQREIRYEAERVGEQPLVPSAVETYADGNLNGTLLDSWYDVSAPVLSSDGRKKIYRTECYLLYGLNRPPLTSEKLLIGVLPLTEFTQNDNRFDPQANLTQNVGP